MKRNLPLAVTFVTVTALAFLPAPAAAHGQSPVTRCLSGPVGNLLACATADVDANLIQCSTFGTTRQCAYNLVGGISGSSLLPGSASGEGASCSWPNTGLSLTSCSTSKNLGTVNVFASLGSCSFSHRDFTVTARNVAGNSVSATAGVVFGFCFEA